LGESKKTIVALGTFDGVHLGHQKILNALLKEAKVSNCKPLVVSFFPHPTHVLTPDKPLKMINSLDERKDLLRENGIETIVIKEFTREFSEQSAYDFIKEELIKKLHMQTLIVGFNHSFGKDKAGDYKVLKQYGKTLGFTVKRIEAFGKEGHTISSTLIRDLLSVGHIQKVNTYLNYSFCLFGVVEKGNQLGRKIGFNTANILLDYPNKIVPKYGVYVVESEINGTKYYGMMNIGNRPTIAGKTRTIEVHYFNLDKDLYYKKVQIVLLSRLRDEFKFDSLEALKNQLHIDKVNAQKFIATI